MPLNGRGFFRIEGFNEMHNGGGGNGELREQVKLGRGTLRRVASEGEKNL